MKPKTSMEQGPLSLLVLRGILAWQAGVKSGQLASAVVGTINVLGTVVAASLMDKFGRKQLLSTSFSGMGLAMLSMAAGRTTSYAVLHSSCYLGSKPSFIPPSSCLKRLLAYEREGYSWLAAIEGCSLSEDCSY